MSKGTRRPMTGAHLGGRGVCRRRSCSAIAAPREVGRRGGHGDGRHHPRPQRSFFLPNSDRRVTTPPSPKLCSWTSPTASKPGPTVDRGLRPPPQIAGSRSMLQLPIHELNGLIAKNCDGAHQILAICDHKFAIVNERATPLVLQPALPTTDDACPVS